MRIVTLIGNRPQFVKAAAVSRLLRAEHEELLVHSGQHYDDELSAIFFEELALPAPDAHLEIGPGAESDQISRIISSFEPIVTQRTADLVLVYGDTSTTTAGALTAVRAGVPLAHVEAGMRSFDRSMPEERNRILADHLSALCLCSTETAVVNLRAESVTAQIELVGDVMADVSIEMAQAARSRTAALERFGVEPGDYALVTAHRPGNVDRSERLRQLVRLLESLPLPAVFPVHPRTRDRLASSGLAAQVEALPGLRLCEPLGYLDFMGLLVGARVVLTDSGGVQKEAYLAEVPCITLRDTTEWVETVDAGWNRLVDLDLEAALEALRTLDRPPNHPDLYGGGRAGREAVAAIGRWASAQRRAA